MSRAIPLSIVLLFSPALVGAAAAQPTPAPTPDATAAGEPAEPAATPEPATSQEPVAEEEPKAGIKYDKAFILSSGDDRFELKINNRSQFRVEVTRPDGADELTAFFVVPRLRLQMEGFAYCKANAFKVEFDFASRGNPSLKDFFVERDLGGVRLRAGQWKRPFTRHQMASDFGLHFVESSIQGQFATDRIVRDLGVAVHNGYDKSPDGIEWVAGIFNGTGEGSRQRLTCTDPADATTCTPSTPSNVPSDFDPVVTARVGYNLGGIKGYQEGDVEGGGFRLAAGLGYKLDLNNFAKNADDAVALGHAVSADILIKVEGFSVGGALALVTVADADPDTDAELAFFADAGYFVVPARLEVAARYASAPTPSNLEETDQELLGALNYYFEQHSFKLMLDAGVIRHSQPAPDDDTTDVQIRTQVQLVF
jgi:hypothetical protein